MALIPVFFTASTKEIAEKSFEQGILKYPGICWIQDIETVVYVSSDNELHYAKGNEQIDKVMDAVAGHLPALNDDGSLVDSGKSIDDFEVTGAAETAKNEVLKYIGTLSDEYEDVVSYIENMTNISLKDSKEYTDSKINDVKAIIPNTLPNPHKIVFTGVASAEYDGSESVELNIPKTFFIVKLTKSDTGEYSLSHSFDEIMAYMNANSTPANVLIHIYDIKEKIDSYGRFENSKVDIENKKQYFNFKIWKSDTEIIKVAIANDNTVTVEEKTVESSTPVIHVTGSYSGDGVCTYSTEDGTFEKITELIESPYVSNIFIELSIEQSYADAKVFYGTLTGCYPKFSYYAFRLNEGNGFSEIRIYKDGSITYEYIGYLVNSNNTTDDLDQIYEMIDYGRLVTAGAGKKLEEKISQSNLLVNVTKLDSGEYQCTPSFDTIHSSTGNIRIAFEDHDVCMTNDICYGNLIYNTDEAVAFIIKPGPFMEVYVIIYKDGSVEAHSSPKVLQATITKSDDAYNSNVSFNEMKEFLQISNNLIVGYEDKIGYLESFDDTTINFLVLNNDENHIIRISIDSQDNITVTNKRIIIFDDMVDDLSTVDSTTIANPISATVGQNLDSRISTLEDKSIVSFDDLAENDWFSYGQGNSNTNACKMILNLDIDLNDKLFRVNSDKNTMLYLGAKKSDGTEGIFYIGGGIGNGELIAITTNQKFKSVTVCRIYVGQFVTFTFNDDGTYKSHTSTTPVPKSDVITKTNTIPFTPTGDYNPATKKYVDDICEEYSPTVRVEKAASDTTVELEPNKLYIFPEMASLTYTLATPENTNIANEYHFVFQSGATATELVNPSNVKVPDGFTVDSSKIYEISILEGCMTYQSWAVN